MLSIAWTRFSRSSKLDIRPSISFAPLTHSSACWLNRSKNLPSVGIKRPNILFSVPLVAADCRPRCGKTRDAVKIDRPGLVALIQRQVTGVVAKLGVLADPGQA